MKAQPLKLASSGVMYTHCSPEEATHLQLCLPCPCPNRILPITIGKKTPKTWEWNGDTEKPTISPSILTQYEHDQVCHSCIRNGMVEFLYDCTHENAGKTLPLEDIT